MSDLTSNPERVLREAMEEFIAEARKMLEAAELTENVPLQGWLRARINIARAALLKARPPSEASDPSSNEIAGRLRVAHVVSVELRVAAADEIDRLTKREAELVAENNSMRWKLTDLGQRLATAEGRADELSRALKEQP